MRITIVGVGYVGLVSGACFADFGHQVTCVDKDASKISALQRGKIPIFEPDLDRLVQNNVKPLQTGQPTVKTRGIWRGDMQRLWSVRPGAILAAGRI